MLACCLNVHRAGHSKMAVLKAIVKMVRDEEQVGFILINSGPGYMCC